MDGNDREIVRRLAGRELTPAQLLYAVADANRRAVIGRLLALVEAGVVVGRQISMGGGEFQYPVFRLANTLPEPVVYRRRIKP